MFDSGAEIPLNRVPPSDSDDIYDGNGPMNYGIRARITAKNYENYRHWDGGGLQFGGETKVGEDESGVCSPPLWKTSPGTTPLHPQNSYRNLSPASKAQAIARGQRELMDMIRNMPESSYELSLKDLVEHPRTDVRHQTVAEERSFSGEGNYGKEKEKRKGDKKKHDKKAQMMRSGSMDNGGFLLKLVFPISFGWKNKKRTNNSASNTCAKVSPKPPPSDGSSKVVDKEWWKKRFSASGESESGGTSSNSGSTGSRDSSSSSSSGSSSNRHRSGHSTGCWSFFHTKKIKMPI